MEGADRERPPRMDLLVVTDGANLIAELGDETDVLNGLRGARPRLHGRPGLPIAIHGSEADD